MIRSSGWRAASSSSSRKEPSRLPSLIAMISNVHPIRCIDSGKRADQRRDVARLVVERHDDRNLRLVGQGGRRAGAWWRDQTDLSAAVIASRIAHLAFLGWAQGCPRKASWVHIFIFDLFKSLAGVRGQPLGRFAALFRFSNLAGLSIGWSSSTRTSGGNRPA